MDADDPESRQAGLRLALFEYVELRECIEDTAGYCRACYCSEFCAVSRRSDAPRMTPKPVQQDRVNPKQQPPLTPNARPRHRPTRTGRRWLPNPKPPTNFSKRQ